MTDRLLHHGLFLFLEAWEQFLFGQQTEQGNVWKTDGLSPWIELAFIEWTITSVTKSMENWFFGNEIRPYLAAQYNTNWPDLGPIMTPICSLLKSNWGRCLCWVCVTTPSNKWCPKHRAMRGNVKEFAPTSVMKDDFVDSVKFGAGRFGAKMHPAKTDIIWKQTRLSISLGWTRLQLPFGL